MLQRMSEALAFLLTFRTYGTWLHGDERGSVDGEHNVPGTPLLPPDPARQHRERGLMKADGMILDERLRLVVDAAIADQCRHRGVGAAGTRGPHEPRSPGRGLRGGPARADVAANQGPGHALAA